MFSQKVLLLSHLKFKLSLKKSLHVDYDPNYQQLMITMKTDENKNETPIQIDLYVII